MDRRHAVLGAATAWQLMRPCTPSHAQVASPQPAAGAPLSVNEPLPSAAADVSIIGRLMRELHPGVYRYQTPAQLEAGLQRLEQAFGAGSNLRHRYLALSQFLMPLRCGHSYANFYNQRRALGQALFSQHSRLPFALFVAGRRRRCRRCANGRHCRSQR